MWATIIDVLQMTAIVAGKLLFVLALPVAVVGSLFGLPGGFLVLVDATIYSALHGWESPAWYVLLVLLALAVLSELAESALALAGVKHSGGGAATGVWTIIGGMVGVMVGGVLAPVLGAVGGLAGPIGALAALVLAPLLLGLAGGYLGGYWYELRRGRSPEEAKRIGWAALAGRLSGSALKAILVAVMAVIVLVTSFPTLF